MRAFPLNAPGVRLSATAATGRIALPTFTNGTGAPTENVRVVNEGPNTAYLRGGDVTVNAAVPTGTVAPDSAVLAGEDVIFSISSNMTHIAAICNAGGTATLNISEAEGW